MSETIEQESVDTEGTALGGDETEQETEQQATDTEQSTDTKQSQQEEAQGDDESNKDATEDEKSEEESEADAFDPDKLELPEGFELDEQMMEQFKPLAEELGIGQEQAQKLMSMHTEAVQNVQQQMQDQHAQQVEQWATDAKSDQEFGGDHYGESLQTAKKALQQFGSPELIQMLNQTGLGNHPELIRAFYRAGKNLSEDTFDGSAPAGGQERSLADRMYPNS